MKLLPPWPSMHYVILGAALILPSSCVKFEPKNIDPLKTAVSFESRSFADKNLLEFIEESLDSSRKHVIPIRKWDLNKLTLASIYFNQDMQVAIAQWKVSLAQIETANQSPNPTISAFPQFISNPHNLPSWAYSFNLNIPIETAGKRELRVSQAEKNADALRYQIEEVAWGLRSKVRDAMLVLYKTSELRKLADKEAGLQEEENKIYKERVISEKASKIKKVDSDTLLSKSNLKSQELDQQAAEAKVVLANVIGVPSSALSEIEIDFNEFSSIPVLSEDVLRKARAQALKGRYNLLSALANYSASSKALELEIAKQYPDINLNPSYVWFQGANRWGLGLAGVAPVVNQNEGPIHEAEARRDEAAAKFMQLQEQIIGEIELRTIAYRAALKTLKIAEENLASIKTQETSARKLLRPGDISRQLLLQSDLNLISAETNYLNSQVLAQAALGNLEKALQVPLVDSVSQINKK